VSHFYFTFTLSFLLTVIDALRRYDREVQLVQRFQNATQRSLIGKAPHQNSFRPPVGSGGTGDLHSPKPL
jgi:hypothetical protein